VSKTGQALRNSARDVNYKVTKAGIRVKQLTPEKVAAAGGKMVKKKVKRLFPTFTKVGKKVARGLSKTVLEEKTFETPAQRLVPGLMRLGLISGRDAHAPLSELCLGDVAFSLSLCGFWRGSLVFGLKATLNYARH